jgi:60 kDa SS-A/Ro ribonucleoprotein
MALNTVKHRTRRVSTPTIKTHEGAPAYVDNAKRELYILAATSLFSGDSFYEKQDDRLKRFRSLIGSVLKDSDGAKYIAALTKYARNELHLRTTPALLTAELFLGGPEGKLGFLCDKCNKLVFDLPAHKYKEHFDAKADQLNPKTPYGSMAEYAVDAATWAWERGDEVLESTAYFDVVGSKFTAQFKKAVARYLATLNEYKVNKYKGESRTYTMRDIVRLFHPNPGLPWRSALLKFVSKGWAELSDEEKAMLPMIGKVKSGEGQTWEQKITKAGESGEVKAEDWEKSVDSMGHMALLRNLRNIVQKGVSEEVLRKVAERISNREEVAKAKQFPYRYYSAYTALPSGSPKYLTDAIAKAMDQSADQIAGLDGKIAIVIDRSGSMYQAMSKDSEVKLEVAASALGAMFARKGNADIYVYSYSPVEVRIPSNTPVIAAMNGILGVPGMGGVTNLGGALARVAMVAPAYDYIIVLTDEQAHDDAMKPVRDRKPKATSPWVFCINMAGYHPTVFDPKYPGVVRVGGFSDRVLDWIRAVWISDPVSMILKYAYPEA